MEVTDSDAACVPSGNLRVPRDHFVAIWRAAVRQDDEQSARGTADWYAGAVAVTCRWLATAPTHPANGPGGLPRSPATRRSVVAYEELIEAEFVAAERLGQRRPDLLTSRPGWCEGVRATLRWAWRCEGPPPIEVPTQVAS